MSSTSYGTRSNGLTRRPSLGKSQKYSAWYLRKTAPGGMEPRTGGRRLATDNRVKIGVCPGEEKWIFASFGTARWTSIIPGTNLPASGNWGDLPKTNTRDWSGRQHGWGLDRFSVRRNRGLHEVRVRVARRDSSGGPESFVKFRVE